MPFWISWIVHTGRYKLQSIAGAARAKQDQATFSSVPATQDRRGPGPRLIALRSNPQRSVTVSRSEHVHIESLCASCSIID